MESKILLGLLKTEFLIIQKVLRWDGERRKKKIAVSILFIDKKGCFLNRATLQSCRLMKTLHVLVELLILNSTRHFTNVAIALTFGIDRLVTGPLINAAQSIN